MAKIRKRGNSYQIDYFDPNGKRVRKSFDKKKDAEAELGKRVSLIAEKRYLDVKKDYKTTFKELLTKYKENYKSQSSFNNWKRFCIERFKSSFGEDTRLDNIRYVDLETYRNKLKQKTLNLWWRKKMCFEFYNYKDENVFGSGEILKPEIMLVSSSGIITNMEYKITSKRGKFKRYRFTFDSIGNVESLYITNEKHIIENRYKFDQ